jgi:hypothetical protein
MPPKRAFALRAIEFCAEKKYFADCSLLQGVDVILGKGIITCDRCRRSYDFPAPMPGKRSSGGAAAAKILAAASENLATGTKMTRQHYHSLMLW